MTNMMALMYKLLAVGTFMLMVIPCIQTGTHSIVTFYTQLDGSRQEFYAVTEVDGKVVFSNDSTTKSLTYKQEWVKKLMSDERWKEEFQNREKMQKICEKNVLTMKRHIVLKEGMQTFQRMFGCKWNDETEDVEEFDTYGYDGEDFISLDIQEKKYVAFSPQALHTRDMWNRDRPQLEFLVNYYSKDCIFWLKEILLLRKTEVGVSPDVSLLKKDPTSPVVCHVTGFFPPLNITWTKSSKSMNDKVENGTLLPNEDGTFQQSVTLNILPEEWERSTYYCNVRGNGVDKNIWKDVSKHDREVKSNYEIWYKRKEIVLPAAAAIVSAIIIIAAWMKCRNRSRCEKTNLVSGNSEASQPLVNDSARPGAKNNLPNIVVYNEILM